MGRPRKPDGRRVPVSFKLTDAEAALVDSLRGNTERSTWIRDTAIAAAGRLAPPLVIAGVKTGITAGPRQPPGTVSVIAPGEEATEIRPFALAPKPVPGECPHPPARILRGLCNACGRHVGS